MMHNLLLLLLLIFTVGCNNTSVAGGSDLPNGVIGGVVVASTGVPAVNATAKLIEITVTERGDSTVSEQIVSTNSAGVYEFPSVENGPYVLIVSTDENELAIRSRVVKTDDSLQVEEIHTRNCITVQGRVLYSDEKPQRVVIPGVSSSVISDDGFYTLQDVPVGDIEIMSLGNTEMSVLSITVAASLGVDTASIRDCRFGGAASAYSLHSSSFQTASVITPEIYAPGAAPEWYRGVDFGGVKYGNGDSDDLRPLWYFPVLVEITPATIDVLGSLDNVVSHVNAQFERANEFFSDSKFDGRIHFGLDSIGIVDSPADEFLQAPEDSYALRVVYDFKNEINVRHHNDFEEQTFVLNQKLGSLASLFGAEGDTELFGLLARSRGAKFLWETGIDDYENSVSNTTFARKEFLMWGGPSRTFSDQTIGIINENSSDYRAVEVSAEFLPTLYEVKVISDNGPVANAEVKAYGINSERGKLNVSPRYHGVTNAEGVFTFDENPYVLDNTITRYKNYLIEIVLDSVVEKQYRWMPYFDAVGTHLSSEIDIYTVTFTL